MRKFSLVLVAAMLLSSGSLLANDADNVNPSKKLSVQIAQMLRDNSFTIEKVDMTADVRFTLNNEKEIVVLSVDTEDFGLEGFVKAKLNYKKVDLEQYTEGKVYTIPVRIVR